MSIAATTTVGELAAKLPHATRVFEKYGIDYCCGGGKSIAEACQSAGIRMEEIIRDIEQERGPAAADQEYASMNLRALVDHILGTHHVYTRDELPRLDALLRKVISVHGERHPELNSVQNAFRLLSDDLMPHLLKEENILFPYILGIVTDAERGARSNPPPFMTIQNPIRMMQFEHDAVGDMLRELRSATSGYTAPADGCASFNALYAGLQELEKDIHQHIHLENNILFPRAVDLESQQLR